MRITVEPREGFAVLHLRGEFDSLPCAFLRRGILALIRAGSFRIVLDLELVTFINSQALGAILEASHVLASCDGALVIARPSALCRKVVDRVGLERVIPVFDTAEQAGAALLEEHEPEGRARTARLRTSSSIRATW